MQAENKSVANPWWDGLPPDNTHVVFFSETGNEFFKQLSLRSTPHPGCQSPFQDFHTFLVGESQPKPL